MGEKTGIQWCDHTFNPWIGCTKVSDGCKFCYAERDNNRYKWVDGWGEGKQRRRTSGENWKKPLQWAKAAIKAGVVRRVFCASLADVFDADVPQIWRENLWDLIRETALIEENEIHTSGLEWLILTKRPENIRRLLPLEWQDYPPYYIRLGVTAENQEMADYRIPKLLEVWSGKNFVSVEPMLEDIDISKYIGYNPKYENTNGRTGLSSSDGWGAGNRLYGKNLENSQTNGEQMEWENQSEQMRKSKSGTPSSARLFTGSSNVQQSSFYDRSAQNSLPSLFREDTGRINDQSQKRSQDGQSTRESGINDLFRTSETLALCSEKQSAHFEPVRGEKQPGEINRSSSIRNQREAVERGASFEDSRGLRSCVSNNFENSQNGISWCIAGCESGPGARPFSMDWARSLRDQCQVAGVPYFLKQIPAVDGKLVHMPELDGRVWNQFPEATK